MRHKSISLVICAFTLLTACSEPSTPLSDLLIFDFDDELFRRHTINLKATEELSLAEVYGKQWKEYAVICSSSDTAVIKERFGLTETPFDKKDRLAEDENYLYLSDKKGGEQWIKFYSSLDFCTVDDPGITQFGSPQETMYFKLTERGTWERIKTPPQKSTEPTSTTKKAAP